MSALRILMLTNRVPWPLNDGGNIATYHVAKGLQDAGHRVLLLSLNTLKHKVDMPDIPGIHELKTVSIDTTVTRMGLLRGLLQSKPYNVERFRSTAYAGLLRRCLKQESWDLVVVEGAYMGIYLPLIREHSKARVVLRSHNVEHEIWARLAEKKGSALERFYLRRLTPKIRRFELETLKGYDAIVAITDRDAHFYKQNGAVGPVDTIPAGVDLETFQPPEPPEWRPSIAFLGSLEWLPNLEGLEWFLGSVWPLLRAQWPGAEFHIAGKNPPASLPGADQPGVHLHGYVPDAAEFMAAHSLFVTPLRSGGGMRLKVIEAMAMARCVVSTHVGAEGIWAEDGRHLFLRDAPEAIAELLAELLGSPEDALRTGEAAREFVRERFGWPGIIRKFEHFYRRIL